MDSNTRQHRRFHGLDFLRGFFVFLAFYEHFGHYLNYWFVEFFREKVALDYMAGYYDSLVPFVGKRLAMDHLSHHFATIFVPWVSQVYLFLACFNLGKRNQDETRSQLKQKLLTFFVLFCLFTMENFIVAPNLGEALSVYPIQTWMIVLSILVMTYSFIGKWGVIFLAVLFGPVRFLIPEYASLSIDFEQFMALNIHPEFEYDARVEYFMTSGALGFLMGDSLFKHGDKKPEKWFLGFGAIGMILYFLLGPDFEIEWFSVLDTEHDLIKNFWGSIGVWGTQCLVVSLVLLLDRKAFPFQKIPFFSWLGVYSVFVFAFHRIFFVHLYGPLWAWFYAWMGWQPRNHTIDLWIGIAMLCGLSWCILKSRVIEFLVGRR